MRGIISISVLLVALFGVANGASPRMYDRNHEYEIGNYDRRGIHWERQQETAIDFDASKELKGASQPTTLPRPSRSLALHCRPPNHAWECFNYEAEVGKVLKRLQELQRPDNGISDSDKKLLVGLVERATGEPFSEKGLNNVIETTLTFVHDEEKHEEYDLLFHGSWEGIWEDNPEVVWYLPCDELSGFIMAWIEDRVRGVECNGIIPCSRQRGHQIQERRMQKSATR